MGAPEGLLGQEGWQGIKERQSHYARGGKWALDFVRPAILSNRNGRQRKLRSTAYLDGLRGFAALLVYWGHHQLWAHDSIGPEAIFENAYGYNEQYYFATLPGIRLFFSGGHFAVSIFFILSGYVLSMKPLQLIHAGEMAKLGDNLAASLFKRWLRLYFPIICCTGLYMASWHVLHIRTAVEPQKTFYEELWKWYLEFKNFSFVFRTDGDPWFTYSFHVWSIPTEMRGSIIIYTSVMAFSRATRNARLWCTAGLISYFMYIVDGWYGSMFLMGMLQCDLDMLAASDNLPSPMKKLERFKMPIFYTLLVIGLYLGGSPAQSADTAILKNSPGWVYLSHLKPQALWDYKWFFLFWAATFTVSAIPRIPWLKAFFEMRFNMYLGRISFSFYLVHGPVLWTIADRIYASVGCMRESHVTNVARWINKTPLPNVGPLGLEFNFLASHLLILPITLWLAEMATKLFDEPSVKIAKWAYERTLPPQEFTEKTAS